MEFLGIYVNCAHVNFWKFCTFIYSRLENAPSTEALMSFFIIKRFDFFKCVSLQERYVSLFLRDSLVYFFKFMMKKIENKISILVIKLNCRKVFLPTWLCINKNVSATRSINKQDQNCWSTSASKKERKHL